MLKLSYKLSECLKLPLDGLVKMEGKKAVTHMFLWPSLS